MPHRTRRILFILLLIACFSAAAIYYTGAQQARAAAAKAKPKPPPAAAKETKEPKAGGLRNIPYTKAADPKNARRQTLDLYLPPKSAKKPPLVVFIHGGFWTLTDDDYKIGPAFAEALVPAGAAVALVRYRLAPASRHPAQAEDVAAAVAFLIKSADKYGYDTRRIFLAGHSAGAHLATLVALDPGYLEARGASPKSLAGVIGFSGLYDLRVKPDTAANQRVAVEQAFGDNADRQLAASPVAHASAAAPPFLILSAEDDFPGFLPDSKRFADALVAAGHKQVERLVVPERDHFSMLQVAGKDDEVRSILLEFLKLAPFPADMVEIMAAKRRWREPPFSTAPFWSERNKNLIQAHPVDQRLVAELAVLYGNVRYELLEWPLENYYAIDLFAYLDAEPPENTGRGNYLTVTNFRNEKLFWDRRELERYKPVIVVGLDDEKNLFRLSVFYQARREYSWRDGPQPPIMARPLGAFIHFLEEPPEEWVRQAPYYALAENSFRLTEQNPLAALSGLPKEVREALTSRNGCVYCHSFRGVGSESQHVTALGAKPHGGRALPLESYPEEVWKRFMFHPEEAAQMIGASPNPVDEEARQALYDLVVEGRMKESGAGK